MVAVRFSFATHQRRAHAAKLARKNLTACSHIQKCAPFTAHSLAHSSKPITLCTGPQALFGYQVAYAPDSSALAHVALAAEVGQDLPSNAKAWLQERGADLGGLLPGPLPTPRAWQLFEQDGRRTQVWRVPASEALYTQLLPPFERLPLNLQSARAYHVGMHPERYKLQLLQQLRCGSRAANIPINGDHSWVSVETFTSASAQLRAEALERFMRVCDIFSPNLVEAESMVGPGSPEEVRVP